MGSSEAMAEMGVSQAAEDQAGDTAILRTARANMSCAIKKPSTSTQKRW